MQNIARYFAASGTMIMATDHILVDVTDTGSIREGIRWTRGCNADMEVAE